MRLGVLNFGRNRIAAAAIIAFIAFSLVYAGYTSSSGQADIGIEVINISGGEIKKDTMWVKVENRENRTIDAAIRVIRTHSSSYRAWKTPDGSFVTTFEPGETRLLKLEASGAFSPLPTDTKFKLVASSTDEKWWKTTPFLEVDRFVNQTD